MRLNIAGHVDGLLGEGLSGWVCAPDSPEQRLWVELLVDDCPVGIARAENHHPAALQYGDGNYGFWLPLPPVLRDTEGTARVRVANTDCLLESAVRLCSPKPNAALLGAVSNDAGLTMSGWVRDPAEPESVLHVSAWLDGKMLAETSAHERRFRPETSDGHGFSLSLPMELADGVSRTVHVMDEKKRPLPGSPVLVCAMPKGLAGWFASQKKFEAPQRNLTGVFLGNYEQWLPKGVRLDQFAAWEKCFPVPDIVPQKNFSDNFVLLSHNEAIHPRALAHLAKALVESNADVAYADGIVKQNDGTLLPLCRPAWDIYRFLCEDFLGPILVRTALTERAQTRTQLILAAHLRGGICHVPQFLSESPPEPVQPHLEHTNSARAWMQDHAKGVDVLTVDGEPNRICWKLAHAPLVSVLIPTRDKATLLQACLESLHKSTYKHVEILLLDNDSQEMETRKLFRAAERQRLCRYPVRIIPCPGPFNYAAINNRGAQEAKGELLCLLNNDTEVIQPDWLEEMLGIALNPLGTEAGDGNTPCGIGAVGAKLLWPNHLTQHAGVVVGTHQLAAHIGNQWPADDPGYMNLNSVTRQVSAVTAACLLTPRKLFLELGGFDAARFPVAFNDVDYCLRLRKAGKAIVWTPHAQLMHHESASRGHDETLPQKSRASMEMQNFRARWGEYTDPFYNPNLSLSTVLEPFAGLALPPRARSIQS